MYNNVFVGMLIVLGIFSICSCAVEEEEAFVNPVFDEYFVAFETAAAERGFDINLNDFQLEAHITLIEQDGVAGVCQTYDSGNLAIRVDNEYWEDADELEREFVIFHELGHCILNRLHNDTADNSGRCLSIMHSGLSGCELPYNDDTRSRYLDELFR